MGIGELYLCCYFPHEQDGVGRHRFAYINQHCGPLFSGLFGLTRGEGGQHGRGKARSTTRASSFTIICN